MPLSLGDADGPIPSVPTILISKEALLLTAELLAAALTQPAINNESRRTPAKATATLAHTIRRAFEPKHL